MLRFFSTYKASAADVKKLRQMTSSPMGDCVKALNTSEGDFNKAKEWLRKKGLASADKRADRFTTQGLIGLKSNATSVAMVQFACETDFVAKTDRFIHGCQQILDTVQQQNDLVVNKDEQVPALMGIQLLESMDPDVQTQTVEDGVKFVISKTQENCNLVRAFRTEYDSAQGEVLATYLHNKLSPEVGKIGSLFVLKTDSKDSGTVFEIANTLAMHTAAMKPSYLSKDDVPQSAKDAAIEDQKHQTLQKLKEDVPEAAKQKALAGAEKSAISKLHKSEVLYEQELAMGESNETVGQYLKTQSKELGTSIEIRDWALFQIK